MKVFIPTNTSVTKVVLIVQSPVKVCMHVRGVARADVRVMREATALEGAGFAVSVVDIENDTSLPVEEDMGRIHLKRLVKPGWLIPARFKPCRLARTVQKLIASTFLLVRTPADFYHAHDANALLPCCIAAQLRRTPLDFDAHEMPVHELEDTRFRWLRAVITQIFAGMIRRCAGVNTFSSPIIGDSL